MQAGLLLPLCGVRKGWGPKQQATLRAGARQAQKAIGNQRAKRCLPYSRSTKNASSGDRPSPHHALGQKACRARMTARECEECSHLAPGAHTTQRCKKTKRSVAKTLNHKAKSPNP
ncbi:hypothetical protein NDU88_000344 [Pleurodeles waltl]|uniref:Uncharacterized protein n=1 Tax=Pleurodeles waltl TaxID=8319 RepID=A0AAV7V4U4_PLEWA|nr:hypothetical protein NDU88_000344 [Pleurodeles waltl]